MEAKTALWVSTLWLMFDLVLLVKWEHYDTRVTYWHPSTALCLKIIHLFISFMKRHIKFCIWNTAILFTTFWSAYLILNYFINLNFPLPTEIDHPVSLSGDGYLSFTNHRVLNVRLPWFNGISFRTRQKTALLMAIELGEGTRDKPKITVKIEVGFIKWFRYNMEPSVTTFMWNQLTI